LWHLPSLPRREPTFERILGCAQCACQLAHDGIEAAEALGPRMRRITTERSLPNHFLDKDVLVNQLRDPSCSWSNHRRRQPFRGSTSRSCIRYESGRTDTGVLQQNSEPLWLLWETSPQMSSCTFVQCETKSWTEPHCGRPSLISRPRPTDLTQNRLPTRNSSTNDEWTRFRDSHPGPATLHLRQSCSNERASAGLGASDLKRVLARPQGRPKPVRAPWRRR